MQLSEFIAANHQNIIKDWVAFARTMVPWADGMNHATLQDHAEELLEAVVNDMRSPQNDLEQSEKSKGRSADGGLAKTGKRHASERLKSGLNLNQLVSEYRALRASVLRLWEKTQGDENNDVIRFSEAIDEALSKSTAQYSETMDKTREQFLGILSHDLRNPIGAIIMGSTLLTETGDADTREIALSILNSGERMNRMVNDLLDLTRTRLGAGIPITCKPTDLAAVCRQVISELQTTHPETHLTLNCSGDLQGEWDSDRLAQVVSNLVANALQYGTPKSPVTICAKGDRDEVSLIVHNDGPPIPESAIKMIFAPMARHLPGGQNGDRNVTGLGLGLYIAYEIVAAHDGTITVTSAEEHGTSFTVTIPRSSLKNPQQRRH